MEWIASLDTTSIFAIGAAALIIVLALFARFIQLAVKLAIVAAMAIFILYFLRQAGLF